MNHRRWKVLHPSEHLNGIAGLTPLVAQLLYNRGITEPAQVEPFLAADKRLSHDPLLLPDMERAVARIYQAMLSGETIAIYGDFDADGICGTALLIQGLSSLGAKVIPYIPHRVKEGYGLSSASLESLLEQGATLVITVDCGISSIEEVEYGQKIGLDIIVTDHHSILSSLPPCIAVVNPKREDSTYPSPQLAGVGVAFKLLEALFQTLGREEDLNKFLDLVALGTVADVMPLIGENRYLVKQGLEVLNRTPHLGLQEMVRIAGLQMGNLDSESISWILGPRLNAAGRIDHAITSYRLLITDSSQEAHSLAQELEQKNAQRQRLTQEVLAKAKQKLLSYGIDSPLLMVGGEDYPPGVVGLVASKLAEEFYRPALVFELSEDISRGSARSIPEFDLIAALGECQDLLSRFGGHTMAAGFTLPTQNLAYFQQRLLNIAAKQLSGVDLRPSLNIEAELPLFNINPETFKSIQQLAPFGKSNPVPTLLSRGVRVVECHPIGSNHKHLRIKLRQGNIVWQGIGFDLGHLLTEVTPSLDIVYNLVVDRWGSEEMLALNILDFAPLP